MNGILEAWIKVFSEPLTLRRAFRLLVPFLVVIGSLLLYERYTSSFRIARLQKAADLVARMQEIEARGTNHTAELDRARKALLNQVAETIEMKPLTVNFVPTTVTFSMQSLWKFLAGGALWSLLALLQIQKWRTPAGRKEILTALCMAAGAGGLGMFVPSIWWPWFHLLVYPWMLAVGIVIAMAPLAMLLMSKAGLKKAKERAQAISCSNNLKQVMLSARSWALDHKDTLPTDFVSMKTELGTEEITTCPADKSVNYEILSPGTAEVDPSIAYVRCPIHNNVGFVSGSVRNVANDQVIRENGKWKCKPSTPAAEQNPPKTGL